MHDFCVRRKSTLSPSPFASALASGECAGYTGEPKYEALGKRPIMLTADEVTTVEHYCVHLRSVWRHYQILFEEGELRRALLHRIAPVFFGDLNQILIEQLILQICKLTDPETTMGGITGTRFSMRQWLLGWKCRGRIEVMSPQFRRPASRETEKWGRSGYSVRRVFKARRRK